MSTSRTGHDIHARGMAQSYAAGRAHIRKLNA